MNLTHAQDEGQAQESWSMRKNATEVLECIKKTGLEWDEKCWAVVRLTPPNSIVDYKIIFPRP